MSFYDYILDCSSPGIINTSTSSTTPSCSPTTTMSMKKDFTAISPGNQFSWYSIVKFIFVYYNK